MRLRYDRARYHPEATAEQREAERQQALREGGITGSLWSALGLGEEKRRGYREKWAGYGGDSGKGSAAKGADIEAAEREREQRGESAPGVASTAPSSYTGAPASHSGVAGSAMPPGMISQSRATPATGPQPSATGASGLQRTDPSPRAHF